MYFNMIRILTISKAGYGFFNNQITTLKVHKQIETENTIIYRESQDK